jgi:hypothetical protein
MTAGEIFGLLDCTAVHEAAHAVLSLHFGGGVQNVRLCKSPNHKGCCSITWPRDVNARASVMQLIGGDLAEEIFCNSSPGAKHRDCRRIGCGCDSARAEAELREAFPSLGDPEIARLRAGLEIEVREILKRPDVGQKVRDLAAALLAAPPRLLSGPQVRGCVAETEARLAQHRERDRKPQAGFSRSDRAKIDPRSLGRRK